MAITRSWEGVRPHITTAAPEPPSRAWTLLPLLAASFLVVFGLYPLPFYRL